MTVPFRLDDALNDQALCTKGGKAVRLLNVANKPGRKGKTVIVAHEDGREAWHFEDGRLFRDKECPMDLVMITDAKIVNDPVWEELMIEIPSATYANCLLKLKEAMTPKVPFAGSMEDMRIQAMEEMKAAMRQVYETLFQFVPKS